VYDQFVVGHAGTSIATAIGMAIAQQLSAAKIRNSKSKIRNSGSRPAIVAVVGDASIVNGVSFEALNNL
jgi:deoxyxylulose-5-phosphate synthase